MIYENFFAILPFINSGIGGETGNLEGGLVGEDFEF